MPYINMLGDYVKCNLFMVNLKVKILYLRKLYCMLENLSKKIHPDVKQIEKILIKMSETLKIIADNLPK